MPSLSARWLMIWGRGKYEAATQEIGKHERYSARDSQPGGNRVAVTEKHEPQSREQGEPNDEVAQRERPETGKLLCRCGGSIGECPSLVRKIAASGCYCETHGACHVIEDIEKGDGHPDDAQIDHEAAQANEQEAQTLTAVRLFRRAGLSDFVAALHKADRRLKA